MLVKIVTAIDVLVTMARMEKTSVRIVQTARGSDRDSSVQSKMMEMATRTEMAARMEMKTSRMIRTMTRTEATMTRTETTTRRRAEATEEGKGEH
jgi:hypothetical protein